MATINDTVADVIAASNNQTTDVSTGNLGLSIPGTFTLTHDGDLSIDNENGTLTMDQDTIDRQYGYSTLEPTYYIKIGHDINSEIRFESGGNDSTDPDFQNDDAWGTAGFTVESSNAATRSAAGYADELSLPRGVYTDNVGVFTLTDLLDTPQTKTYGVNLTINLENDGTVSANAALNDSDPFSGFAPDVFQLAQTAFWPYIDGSGNTQTVNNSERGGATQQNDDDILVASITSANVESHFATNIAAIEDDINDHNSGNVVSSWSISVSEVVNHPNNNLSRYAQVNNINDTNIFSVGDQVVISSPADYQVTLTAAGGSANGEDIVNEKVYAILHQV